MTDNSYEDQMFAFFTQPENFETMMKVVKHVDAIKKRLVYEFWDEVIKKLREKLGPNWIVEFSDNWSFQYNKLLIYKPEWRLDPNYRLPIACVAFERILPDTQPFLGIFIGAGSKMFKGVDLKDKFLKTDAYKNNVNTFKTDGNGHWAFFKNSHLKFYESDSLSKLVPQNRQIEIENLVLEAIDLLDKVKDITESLIKSAKDIDSQIVK